MANAKFFKEGNHWVYQKLDEDDVHRVVTPGDYMLASKGDIISIEHLFDNGYDLFKDIDVKTIDSNSSGTAYVSIAEFVTATEGFFIGGESGGGGDASSIIFDSDRPIKSIAAVGFNPSGATVADFINNTFYPFLPATVSMNSFALQEVGVLYSPAIVGVITLHDETTVTERRVIRDPAGADTTINNPASNSVNYVDTDITIIEGATEAWRIEADVANDGSPTTKVSPTRTLSGVFPFFWGMDATAALSGTALYGALIKSVTSKANKNVTFNDSNKYIYFCYPASYSNLTSIKDPNNFEVLGSFTQTTVNVTSTGLGTNYTESYKVYRTNALTTVNNGLFQFKF